MRVLSHRFALMFAALFTVGSCTGDSATTGPSTDGPSVSVAPQLALIPSAGDATALPVNRIRSVTARTDDGAVLDETSTEVSPTDDVWELSLSIPGQDGVSVVVYVYLLNVSETGAETVQFSGRTDPITLGGDAALTPDVVLVRGPLENLSTTGVTITSAPASLLNGESATLVAEATTTAPAQPTVFWTSLDPAILTMGGPVASGIMIGTTRVVASAGAFADTVSIRVGPADTIPPSVTSTVPVADATDIPRSVVVAAAFDELMDVATITNTTFTLLDGSGALVPASVGYADASAFLTPTSSLDSVATYTATVTTGVQDLAGNALASPVSWTFTTNVGATVLSTFNPGLGVLVAVAFDPVSGNLFLYEDFAATIEEYSTDGSIVGAIPSAGVASNDIDLDFLPVDADIGGTLVPANALLVLNGETGIGELFAVDKNDGTLLASVTTAIGNQTVGGFFHESRGTFFGVNWVTDQIVEMDLATGAVINSFPVAPVGSPAFDVFFGDIDVDPSTGNILLVSSNANAIRVMDPTGVFIRDYPVLSLGISVMSGVAWDAASGTAWIVTTNGDVFNVGGVSTR
jgi:Bacterial Ig-like domain